MIILGADHLSKSFGERTLFEDITFSVQEKDAVGLVGANGAGKTTLFRMITGQETVDSGLLSRSKQCRVGWMEQHACADEGLTAYDQALSQFASLMEMEAALEKIHLQIEQGDTDPGLLERQQSTMERYEREGGLTYRSRTRSALLGLGMAEEELSLPMAALSGGQRSKVSLARLLVSDSNLLLLDEPTNHLDMKSVEWLEGYLRAYQGAFVVVSHDRYFLDHVTNITWELEHGRLAVCKGNYSAYLEQKERGREIAAKHYEQTRREIARLEGIVAQQRQWNRERNIRTAESKLKVIQKLEQTLVKPEQELEGIRFSFAVKYTGANEVLSARDMGMRYGDKVLFDRAELSLFRRERVFLIGPNGCGKTTLLRLLTGQLEGANGEVRLGSGVTLGYYDQTQSNLHPEKTVLQEVWDDFSDFTQSEIRGALAAFLFRGDDVQKRVDMLSGGERARVAILKLMLTKANLLLLDEPTNHLDIASREALEQALMDYDGTLLMVSHDRYFINKLADRVVAFDGDGLREFAGNYDEYLAALPTQEIPAAGRPPKAEGGGDYKAQKEAQSRLRRAKGAVKRCEEALEQISARVAEIDGQLSSEETAADYALLLSLTAEREALSHEEAEQMERWTEAMTELEQLESGEGMTI